jgi:hypothetical protein
VLSDAFRPVEATPNFHSHTVIAHAPYLGKAQLTHGGHSGKIEATKSMKNQFIRIIALGLLLHGSVFAQTPVRFSGAVNFSDGSGPYSVATADFNRDGNLDVVVVNNSGGNVAVLLGDGKGGMTLKTNCPAGIVPEGVGAGLFNTNGIPDMVASTTYGNAALYFKGVGDGNFMPSSSLNLNITGGAPSRVLTGDFNHDGKLDFVVAVMPDGATTFLGNGDGTFQSAIPAFVSTGNGSAAAGDLNRDGNLDLVLPNSTAKGVYVLLGKGDGTFGPATNFNVPISLASSLYALAVADLNHDGKPDVVAVEQLASNAVTVMMGDGTGKLTILTNYALSYGAVSVAIADLNDDGIPDLLVGTLGGYIQVMLGKGDGTFVQDARLAVPGTAGIVVADFNNDGQPDIVSVGAGNISILLNEFLPPLQIAQAGTQVVLSWPTYATGFQLATTTNLAAAGSWSVMTNTPTVIGSTKVVTNSAGNAAQFYQLQD